MTRGLEVNGRAIVTRVKGRGALTRSLAGLLIRANRFATKRATTREDQVWAGRLIDALTVALRVARGLNASPATPPSTVQTPPETSLVVLSPSPRYPPAAERHQSLMTTQNAGPVGDPVEAGQSALPLGAFAGEDG
jgi:hypothetical protein